VIWSIIEQSEPLKICELDVSNGHERNSAW